MPVYLDTRGNSVLSVAICDRCSRKFAYTDLMPDPNFPGMRVCKEDLDNFDPWRLPARQTENISLRFPRPDVSIDGAPYGQAGAPGDLNLASKFVASPPPLNPFIYNISPTSGPQAGGTSVTINGANFTNVATVKFGGIVASFSIVNSTQIIATSPAYVTTGPVDVSAISTYGTAIAHGAFTYT
jgi:hypothetical protein